MTGRRQSGPLGASESAVTGDLESVLVFPENASERLAQVEEELWERLRDLERRELEAEELAAQGRPFIG